MLLTVLFSEFKINVYFSRNNDLDDYDFFKKILYISLEWNTPYIWFVQAGWRRSLFRKWPGWLWKKSARGMRRRTKGRAIRSTPIFWQCTGHRHRGGEDASNRAIPWWGGRRWRPYRNRRRLACSNETARRVAERPRRRCPFLLVCSRVLYGAFIVENPQSIGLNGERNLANASQLQLRLLSFTTTSPPTMASLLLFM